NGDGAVGVVGRSRQNEDGSYRFYLCWLNNQGGAGCHLWQETAWTELFTVPNGTVQLQDENTLLMIVEGNQIGFQVNDQFLGQKVDDTIQSGNWGMYV